MNKPTPTGAKLAAGIAMENDAMVSDALQELVRANRILTQIVNVARARGSVRLEHFKGEAAFAAGLGSDRAQLSTFKTIIDLLQEAKLLIVTDDFVRPGEVQASQELPAPGVNPAPASVLIRTQSEIQHGHILRLPIPLGPNRLAYIELPEDWKPKELPKLLKLLEIALADEETA